MTPLAATITYTAPGSLMLFGEHAVLYGQPALCAAIDTWMTVSLTPILEKRLTISSQLGDHDGPIDGAVAAPFQFIAACLESLNAPLPYGLAIEIHSEFSSKIGFGSSAALTVATLAGLLTLQDQEITPNALFKKAKAVIQKVQGHGSGCDAAASINGSIIYLDSTLDQVEKLEANIPITVVNCGYKTPTSEVIQIVQSKAEEDPDHFKKLYVKIGASSDVAKYGLINQQYRLLADTITCACSLQTDLGVNTPELQEIIEFLNAQPKILGAKISGSGLGDCVVGFGTIIPTTETRLFFERYQSYDVAITQKGLTRVEA